MEQCPADAPISIDFWWSFSRLLSASFLLHCSPTDSFTDCFSRALLKCTSSKSICLIRILTLTDLSSMSRSKATFNPWFGAFRLIAFHLMYDLFKKTDISMFLLLPYFPHCIQSTLSKLIHEMLLCKVTEAYQTLFYYLLVNTHSFQWIWLGRWIRFWEKWNENLYSYFPWTHIKPTLMLNFKKDRMSMNPNWFL